MKKGDLLLCNDGVTKVEIFDFDETSVTVIYKDNTHRRPISCIGKTLHCINNCWNCREEVSTLFCEKCAACNSLVCRKCGSCQKSTCINNSFGFISNGMHRNVTRFSNEGYDENGVDNGINSMWFDNDGYDIEGYNRYGYNRNGINREGFDRNGCDAHWRKLVGRKIVYIGADSKKKGKIVKCYVVNEVHYVDVEFINGELYRKINFGFARQSGILKLLKKKSPVETPKTIRPGKKAETQDVSDDVRDIFDELQDDYERDGEYRTGFGGCYGEDDCESEYYNPTHPDDD